MIQPRRVTNPRTRNRKQVSKWKAFLEDKNLHSLVCRQTFDIAFV